MAIYNRGNENEVKTEVRMPKNRDECEAIPALDAAFSSLLFYLEKGSSEDFPMVIGAVTVTLGKKPHRIRTLLPSRVSP